MFIIGFAFELSTAKFIKTDYGITIPNKPITLGSYAVTGSCFGLNVEYIFTGANKRLVRDFQRKAFKSTRYMTKIFSIPYKAISGILFLFFSGSVSAHDKEIRREFFLNDHIFKKNHIQFNFTILSTSKARLQNHSGGHLVAANAAIGFLLGFKYQVNFNNKYGLIAGTEAILSGRNFITEFSKNDFAPSLISDYNSRRFSLIQDLVLSLPVVVEKRWLYAKTKYFFANVGARLNFSTGADGDFFPIYLRRVDSSYINVGGTDVYANNDAKPWVSFLVNIGHAWLLKNNNLMQLSVCSNISFTKYVNGIYQVDIPGQPLMQGTYSSTGSFIGLSLNYVFTNANYRIRKAYEKQRGL